MHYTPDVKEKSLIEVLGKLPRIELTITSEAIKIAKQAHSTQIRDNGKSYLEEHIYFVTYLITQISKQDHNFQNKVVSSLLHDTVEDSEDISTDFIKDRFGNEIAYIVGLLTKEKGTNPLTQDEKYEVNKAYLAKLTESKVALEVKLVDRYANLVTTAPTHVLKKYDKYARYNKETIELFIPTARKFGFLEYAFMLEQEHERIARLLAR